MIFLSTTSDGKNTEGIGAMVQAQLFCYSLARKIDVGFSFSKFKNFTHFQHCGMTQESFMDEINSFFNFQSEIQDDDSIKKISLNQVDENALLELKKQHQNDNVIVDLNQRNLLRLIDSLIKDVEKKSIIRSLKNKIVLKNSLKYKRGSFSKKKKNVAIHIRKFTNTDCCAAPVRDLFDKSKETFYENLIKSLSDVYADQEIVYRIYAQGNVAEYQFLNEIKLPPTQKINFHIDEHPLTSLYYMINSNVLVMANSSFSWIAHLYRNHEMVYKKNQFNMSTYSNNVKVLNADGSI